MFSEFHIFYSYTKSLVNTTLTVSDSRPRFVLSGGSYCKTDDTPGAIRGSALVEFACDKSILGPGQPRLVAQLPPGDDEEACAWVIEWRTPVSSLVLVPYSCSPVVCIFSLHVRSMKAGAFGAFLQY